MEKEKPIKSGRRRTDPVMKHIQDDLKELRIDMKAVREKIFDGFDTAIQETRAEVRILPSLDNRIAMLEKGRSAQERLQSCPLKEEVFKRVERRMYIFMGLFTIILTVLTLWRP